MGELKDRLRADLTEAMRARDELRTGTIRMALTALTTAEVAGETARELTAAEELAVITRESKKRREAADAFRQGGRADRAEREDAEAGVLASYLPPQLDDTELARLVDAAVTETGASSPRDMGRVMQLLTPRVAGQAEGRRVADAVKARLSV
ncbi:MAG TPA: GatB/YqeY domain-containing protein [Jiangellales bacterium]|nr:GatB/YqeY domain-containing protein [Jiangellales bacterium]